LTVENGDPIIIGCRIAYILNVIPTHERSAYLKPDSK